MNDIQTQQMPNVFLVKGGINIEMVNVSSEELEKLRQIFVELIRVQIHRIKGGKAILNFDEKGDYRGVQILKTFPPLDKH